MSVKQFVLRLRTAAGYSRVVCAEDASVGELYVLVASQLQLPSEDIELYTNSDKTQKLNPTSTEQLSKCGLQSGDFIFVSSSAPPRIPLNALTKPNGSCRDFEEKTALPDAEGEDRSDVAEASASDTAVSSELSFSTSNKGSSAASRKGVDEDKDSAAKEGAQPNAGNGLGSFQSFDSFLKQRSFAVHDLPLLNDYSPKELKAGKINRLPKSVTLKHQVYRHVDHLELMCVKEFQSFVSFWRNELGGLQQRCGWMIGYYREDDHYEQGIRAVCEAIYEPPQEGDAERFSLLESANGESLAKALSVAERLGLELIGFVFTHPERKELLTAKEVVFLARLQLQYIRSGHFSGYPVCKLVTCCLSPQKEEIVPNAFMISDLVTALVRDGLILDEQPDPLHISVRSAVKASQVSSWTFRCSLAGELLPQILEGGVETRLFDASWAVVRVNESAPKKFLIGKTVTLRLVQTRAFFKYSHFPRENRFIRPSPPDIKVYFNNPLLRASRADDAENWRRFSDFHLLLFVASLFDVETSFALCDSVREEKPVDAAMEELLTSLS